MMRTHTVRAAELDRFVEAGGAERHREKVRRYVQDMFEAGSMRPEWCFVIEEGGRSLGRAAFWTLQEWTSRWTWSCSTLPGAICQRGRACWRTCSRGLARLERER